MILPTIFLMMIAATIPMTPMAISSQGAVLWMVCRSTVTGAIYRNSTEPDPPERAGLCVVPLTHHVVRGIHIVTGPIR